MSKPPRYLWLLLVGGCSFHASCGGKTLDSKKGERMIAARLKDATGQDVAVTCPTGIKIEPGASFDCTLALAGVPGKVHVTQDDDQGNVSFELTDGYVLADKVEPTIVAKLQEIAGSGATVTVNCGDRVRASVPGTFPCTAQVPDQTLAIEVTIKNRVGTIDWKVVTPPAP